MCYVCACVHASVRVCRLTCACACACACACDCTCACIPVHQIVNPPIAFVMRYFISVVFSLVFKQARSNSLAKFNKYLTDVRYKWTTITDHNQCGIVPGRTPGVDLCSSRLEFLLPNTPDCIKTHTLHKTHQGLRHVYFIISMVYTVVTLELRCNLYWLLKLYF